MKLIIITHPTFTSSQSMPRFSRLISDGMKSRGHNVKVWTAKPWAYNLPVPTKLKKWLGYIDQFIIFPILLRNRLREISPDTVFIIADQALGPWVPALAKRPHVIHVHDFMALKSAMGEYHQNPTSWTGRVYQKFILRGFNYGKRFISVSKNSQTDLQHYLTNPADESITIYNGLNYPFSNLSHTEASNVFTAAGHTLPNNGFLLHVGGNQWYKNRIGVLKIYSSYIKQTVNPKPLMMIGSKPTTQLMDLATEINNSDNGAVSFLVTPPTEVVCAAYSMATAFIFPSIAEGFGWPIIEAMACGCPVLTTNEAPMTEVGGHLATYIPSMSEFDSTESWAKKSAQILESIISEDLENTNIKRSARIKYALNFDLDKTLDEYEIAYQRAQKAMSQ